MTTGDRPGDPRTPLSELAEVEALQEDLGRLLREREELRANGAGRERLELNRQAIVKVQWDLSRALIARHGPGLQPA